MHRALMSACLVSAIIASLTGCSYSAPFRRSDVAVSTPPPPGASVLVTVTRAEIRPGARSAFLRQTRRVLADLPRHEGLLGHSYRLEIFGRRAWTMTAWRDAASRDRFAASPVHRDAMRLAAVSTTDTTVATFEVSAASLPMRWAEALRRLEAFTSAGSASVAVQGRPASAAGRGTAPADSALRSETASRNATFP